MEPKKCATPNCDGFVPPDAPKNWKYCNKHGMEKEANKDKDNKICRRKGCNNPVAKPYYSYCQKCFYSDAHLKQPTQSDDVNEKSLWDDDVPF